MVSRKLAILELVIADVARMGVRSIFFGNVLHEDIALKYELSKQLFLCRKILSDDKAKHDAKIIEHHRIPQVKCYHVVNEYSIEIQHFHLHIAPKRD